ncbi:MAG: acyl-CoA-binding protein [Deltaproteobacteria bacterium]|nr:acyl-CoA-binding protein [Deltaproteobacteria bacterium]
MTTQDEFEAAVVRVKGLSKSPSNQDLLGLYGLYKQATSGDVSGKRPGMLDPRGRAKFDAWTSRKGMDDEQARTAYVALVDKLTAG